MPTLKRDNGNYYLIVKGETCFDYSCCSKKRPQRAAKHFCKTVYRQYQQKGENCTEFELSFLCDSPVNIKYCYNCKISDYSGDNKYQKYIIDAKLISKEKLDSVKRAVNTEQTANVSTLSQHQRISLDLTA